jgi:protein-arginine kinase activator protein McsA
MAPPKQAAASKGDPISLIEQKIQSLSAVLSDAVAREEFELCTELRNRIRKGRALKEDIESGFDISEKEIQAI